MSQLCRVFCVATVLCLATAGQSIGQEPNQAPGAGQRELFSRAWQAASRGDRATFEQLKDRLGDYLLYPYLQYEDFRHRRNRVKPAVMAAFLQRYRDWAFAEGLQTSWLRTLGRQHRWPEVLAYGTGSVDTEVRCYVARARIESGDTGNLLPVAQGLWTVGKSQPDACDGVFRWLQQQDGITPGIAWERIRLAMENRQPRLTRYLARFLPEAERVWADRWYQQDRAGYRHLDQAARWSDGRHTRDITAYGLRRLARNDPDRAWQQFGRLDGAVGWGGNERGGILAEIALWSAVGGAAGTPERMRGVPNDLLDDRLLEWWARYELSRESWAEALPVISALSPEAASDARWRYWRSRALLATGANAEGERLLTELAAETNYYGFLAADALDLPYTVCPETPQVAAAQVDRLAVEGGFDRALELHRAGLANWGRSEWKRAARRLDRAGLRTAAALAVRESWPDLAIFALADSGDLRWYEWRFPLLYLPLVEASAGPLQLDPTWVLGTMRSESALAEDALSGAGARGLMQVTPGTARKVARDHGLRYRGRDQLLQAADNIEFGATYLQDLSKRYGGNPVLASGAYNAGPRAVERWLDERPLTDPAIWIENLPYRETREYIPRVLTFATLYEWRLQRPVKRLSGRMPGFDDGDSDGTMQGRQTAEVVCRAPG